MARSAHPAADPAPGASRTGARFAPAGAGESWGMTDQSDDLIPDPDHELDEPVDPTADQQDALMDAIEQEQSEGSAASGA